MELCGNQILSLMDKFNLGVHSQGHAKILGAEVRAAIERDSQEGLQIANSILSCVEKQAEHGDFTQQCSADEISFARHVLLDIVDIFSSYQINDRQFLRRLLKAIFPISRCIDRSIILFEEAGSAPSHIDYQKIQNKFLYILQNVAGWKICSDSYPWNSAEIDSSVTCYLDLPLQRAEDEKGTSPILAEALYGIQHSDILLEILRHTVNPNAFYLWPVILSADLKILQDLDSSTPDEAAHEEAQILKFFCRAHAGFQRILVGTESSKNSSMAQRGMFSENWLMMPASTAFMVPDDWCSNPCPLQHFCRLAIRSQLHEADSLPLGISQLELPLALKKYIDLEY